MLILIGQNTEIKKTADRNRANATAQYMTQLQAGVNSCINQGFIDGSTPVGDYWKILQLQRGSGGPEDPITCLSPAMSQTSPLGLTFSFKLDQAVCAADTCTGFAYSSTPLVDFTGDPRSDVLTKVIEKIGVDGGMSFVADGAKLIGYGNSFQEGNPAGNVPGTVAIKIGAKSGLMALLSQFYKLDGSRKLTGDMNANQKNIKNVNNLVTNSITFDQVKGVGVPGQACAVDKAVSQNANGNGLVICNGGIWQRIGDATTGIGSGVACATKGLTGTDAIGTGFICNGTFWVANQTFGNAGDSCSTAGQTAQSSAGDTLLCRSVNGSNVYVSFVDLMPKTFEVGRYVIRDLTNVIKPNCPTGGKATFTPVVVQTVVDLTVVDPRQGFFVAAVDNGASWGMQIKLTDNNGGIYSTNAYNVQAIVKTECSY